MSAAVFIAGRLGRDPEPSVGPNGEKYISTSVYVADARAGMDWWWAYASRWEERCSLGKFRKGDFIWLSGQPEITPNGFPRVEVENVMTSTRPPNAKM